MTDNSEFLRERKRKAPPPGIAGAEADRTGTGKLKFDVLVLTARQDYGKSFFPRENTLENSGRVVFPDHEESSDRPLKNRILKSLSDLRDANVNTFSQDSPLVFPQVKLYFFAIKKFSENKITEDRIQLNKNKIVNKIKEYCNNFYNKVAFHEIFSRNRKIKMFCVLLLNLQIQDLIVHFSFHVNTLKFFPYK